MPDKKTILIIDDQPLVGQILTTILKEEKYITHTAATAGEGITLFKKIQPDAVFLDIMLPDMPGLEVLEILKEKAPLVPVIIITAYSSVESAIKAIQQGAYHYIPKPFKNREVLLILMRALKERTLVEENIRLKDALASRHTMGGIIGKSDPIKKIFDLVEQAAPSSSTCLIRGESGTGKELVAKALHERSNRSEKPFVVVNSGNISPELLESHLFGHERGSFTGAIARKKGLFEVADGGILFFDEIGNIHNDIQGKLLRVMEEKQFMRVGGTTSITSDVRLIAATNADLEAMVNEGTFRKDLYYRLNVITIDLPPLRDRREDIPLLADHFLRTFERENGKQGLHFSEETLKIFLDYPWPGNVRELENAIERAVVLAHEEIIRPDLLPQQILQPNRVVLSTASLPDGISLQEATEEFQRQVILRALHACGGVQRRAARMLKVKPNTLNVMLKRLQIKV